jgi:hypothetical protein
MIALGDRESVVVEVKSQASLRSDQQLIKLAEAVSAKPGWRFELVVTNPIDRDAMWRGPALDREMSGRLMSDAATLFRHGGNEAAALLLWPVAEAGLRRLADQNGLRIEKDDALYTAKKLAMLGYIDREDYGALQDVAKVRDELAHGVQVDDINTGMVKRLMRVVEGLVHRLDRREDLLESAERY